MKKVKIKQVDAFTSEPFTGNPAGVVTAASGLTVKQMRLIAREMNLSETAFILPSKSPQADMRIRWFTPTHEVDLCGHATIASFHALAEEKKYGMNRTGRHKFKVETKSGVLPVDVVIGKNGGTQVEFGLPVPEFVECPLDLEQAAGALGTNSANFDDVLPVMKDAFQIVLPFRSRKPVFNLKPNFSEIERVCRENDAAALTVLTTDTVDKTSSVHTRCFVPLYGVDEDPVTGSSQGPIGVYLTENKVVKSKGGRISYIAEQGDCMQRPGRVQVELRRSRDGYHSLKILGNAVTVLEGEIHVE